MKLIMLGAPGAGKGTQADIVCETYNIPAFSTGAILRQAVSDETETGKKAKSFMDAGQLVPDEIVLQIISERLKQPDAQNGFILDGVPRTVAQAEALEKMGTEVDFALEIVVGDDIILTRLSGRKMCESCGATYHVTHKKSKIENVCDVCKGKLITRKDDEIKTIQTRLKTYHEQTEPLVQFYNKRNKLIQVDGVGTLEEIAKRVSGALKGS